MYARPSASKNTTGSLWLGSSTGVRLGITVCPCARRLWTGSATPVSADAPVLRGGQYEIGVGRVYREARLVLIGGGVLDGPHRTGSPPGTWLSRAALTRPRIRPQQRRPPPGLYAGVT